MLRRSVLAGLTLVLVMASGGWAAADYRDTYYDRDDRPDVGTDPDLRSTTRQVATVNGRRVLIVSVRAYERFKIAWNIKTHLDSKDGPRRDFVMYIYDADQAGRGCRFHPAGRPRDFIRGRFAQIADRVACRIPFVLVDATKRVRWKLSSISQWKGGRSDRAPNGGGWYA
jgi:hypothetical protein